MIPMTKASHLPGSERQKVAIEVTPTKKGFPTNRKPFVFQCERWGSNPGPTD